MPVCDCAMVPIASRLVQKKVPIPQVITFLLASTSLNPLVLMSTYYAFASVEVVIHRLLLTLCFTIMISIGFALSSKEDLVDSYLSMFTCSSGYIGQSKSKVELLLRHASMEFIRLLKFVFIGGFISTMIQFYIQAMPLPILTNPVLVFAFLVICAAFISVCSTSNAFIARSLSVTLGYPFALLFMVIGPMIDIKNILLMRLGFTNKFIIKYVSFIVVIALIIFVVGLNL